MREEGLADEEKELGRRQQKILLMKKGVKVKRGESPADGGKELSGRQQKILLMQKGVEMKRGESPADGGMEGPVWKSVDNFADEERSIDEERRRPC